MGKCPVLQSTWNLLINRKLSRLPSPHWSLAISPHFSHCFGTGRVRTRVRDENHRRPQTTCFSSFGGDASTYGIFRHDAQWSHPVSFFERRRCAWQQFTVAFVHRHLLLLWGTVFKCWLETEISGLWLKETTITYLILFLLESTGRPKLVAFGCLGYFQSR